MAKQYYLLGDFGGTNFQLRYIMQEEKKSTVLFEIKCANTEFNSLKKILRMIKQRKEFRKNSKAVFALARSIDSDVIELYNADFVFDKKKIIKELNLKSLEFLNDVEALAYAIPTLKSSQKELVKKAHRVKKKTTSVVITCGTGCGKAVLHEGNALQSAGGHIDLPLRENELDIAKLLLQETKRKVLTYEDILSGKGIEAVYRAFYKFDKKNSKNLPKTLSAEKIACTTNNKYARQAKTCFSIVLGRMVRNTVLENVPFGGIYLAGGILQKNSIFNKKAFEKELYYTRQGKLIERIDQVPIYIIKNYNASLDGLYHYIHT